MGRVAEDATFLQVSVLLVQELVGINCLYRLPFLVHLGKMSSVIVNTSEIIPSVLISAVCYPLSGYSLSVWEQKLAITIMFTGFVSTWFYHPLVMAMKVFWLVHHFGPD